MAKTAPQLPTTEMLHQLYSVDLDDIAFVNETRDSIVGKLKGTQAGMVAILGACAPKEAYEAQLVLDGTALNEAEQSDPTLDASERLAIWKPRSDPESWHGEETSNPIGAFRLIYDALQRRNKPSMEVASVGHVQRYGHMLTAAWTGSRNEGNDKLLLDIALADPGLPLSNKNGLEGDIDRALTTTKMLNTVRASVEGAAPVVMMYRGGTNAQTPQQWEKQYRRALELTNGLMFVDIAHGAEMAHDPNGNFQKSADGELIALDHVLQIAEDYGEMPVGFMAEASNAPRVVDPHAPLSMIIEGMLQLSKLRSANSKMGLAWQR